MESRPSTRSRKNLKIESNSPPCSPTLKRRTLRETVVLKQSKGLNPVLQYEKAENIRYEEFETSDDSSDDSSFYGEESVSSSEAILSPEFNKVPTVQPTLNLSQHQEQQGSVFMGYIQSKCAGVFILCILVILLAPAIFINISSNNVEKPNISVIDPLDQTMKFLEEMQNSFPTQPRKTWISFLSALSSVTEEEPEQPAVILLVGGNTAASILTMQCIADQLAAVTNRLFSILKFTNSFSTEVTVQVDSKDLQKQEDIIKEELDAQISTILNKSHSIVFGPLENLPPRAALLLHGYCDNFMAQFKDRVFILTATFDFDNRPRNSEQVDRRLHRLWDSTLGPDQSASLVSRVANNPVFIEPESGPIPCVKEKLI